MWHLIMLVQQNNLKWILLSRNNQLLVWLQFSIAFYAMKRLLRLEYKYIAPSIAFEKLVRLYRHLFCKYP